MELDDEVFADFDLLLPNQVLDESGAFLEDTTLLDADVAEGASPTKIPVEEGKANDAVDVKPEINAGGRRGVSTAAGSATGNGSANAGAGNKRGSGAATTDAKKAKRRRQIAAASRASRARRKRELEDLREENKVRYVICCGNRSTEVVIDWMVPRVET